MTKTPSIQPNKLLPPHTILGTSWLRQVGRAASLALLVGACATQGSSDVDDDDSLADGGKEDGTTTLATRTYTVGTDTLAGNTGYFATLILKSDKTFVRWDHMIPGSPTTDRQLTGNFKLTKTTKGGARHIQFDAADGTMIDKWDYSIKDYAATFTLGTTTFSLDPETQAACVTADDCGLQDEPACNATPVCGGDPGFVQQCSCADTSSSVIKDAKSQFVKQMIDGNGFPDSAKVSETSLPANPKLQYHLYTRDFDSGFTTAYKVTVDGANIYFVVGSDGDTLLLVNMYDEAGWYLSYGERTEGQSFGWTD